MEGNSCIAIPSPWEKYSAVHPNSNTWIFLKWKGHATSGTQITPWRVKWLVTGSWESAKSWIWNSTHGATIRIFRFVPLVIHATATLAADRLCNLHPLALHRKSKQMCPLTVLQTANLKIEEGCTCNGWILESDVDIR